MFHSLWKNARRAALIVGAGGAMFVHVGSAAPATQSAAAKSGQAIETTNVEAAIPTTTPPTTQTTAAANKGVVWETAVVKFDEVFKEDAEVNSTNTVLYFTANWCGFCRQMERTTLANGSVRDRMEKFKRVKVDFDTQPDFVTRYRIDGVPAFVMVNARGEEIARLVGMTEADPFRAWLETSETQAAAQAAAILERRERLAGFAAVLDAKETSADAWTNLKPSLLAMAARGAPEERVFAQKRLLAKGMQTPAELFGGLANEDLSVRLNTAVMLRKIIGAEFNFDPWADAATRAAAIEKLNAVYGTKQVAAPVQTVDAARGYLEEQRKRVSLAYETRFVFFKDAPSAEITKSLSGVLSVEQAKATMTLLTAMAERKEVKIENGPRTETTVGGRMNIGGSAFLPTFWTRNTEKEEWRHGDFQTIELVGSSVGIMPDMLSSDTVEVAFDAAYYSIDGFLDEGKVSVGEDGTVRQKILVNKYGPKSLLIVPGKPGTHLKNAESIGHAPSYSPIFSVYSVEQTLRLRIGESAVIWGETKPDQAKAWTVAGEKSTEVKPWLVLVTVSLPRPR